MNDTNKELTTLITAEEHVKINDFVAQFNTLYAKTAESLIEMARIAYEAKQCGKSVYAIFCERVMMKGDATMSKLVAIGKKYQSFKSHQEHLPSNWTTLYNLTRLSEEAFNEKCDSGDICPRLTGVESLALIGRVPEAIKDKSPKGEKAEITNQPMYGLSAFISCDTAESASALQEVIDFAKSKGLSIRPSADLEMYQEAANESVVEEVA